MRKLWFAAALLILASSAVAQEQPASCDVQIRTATAMMKELMQHVHIMSDRAARHYAVAQALEVELNAAQVEIMRLNREKTQPK